MKKRDIKVVKRDAKPVLPKAVVAVPKKKTEADEQREMVDSVKGWITEHVEGKERSIRSEAGRQNWKKNKAG